MLPLPEEVACEWTKITEIGYTNRERVKKSFLGLFIGLPTADPA